MTQVLTTGPTNPNDPTAAALAYLATQSQIGQMRSAVGRVIHDANSAEIGEPNVRFLAPSEKPDNLVADLAGVVAKQTDFGRRGSSFFTASDQGPPGGLSIEEIAASVR